jgi:hypothetical protein
MASWKFSLAQGDLSNNAIIANGSNKFPLTVYFDIQVAADGGTDFKQWTPGPHATVDDYCDYNLLEFFSGTPINEFDSCAWHWTINSQYVYPTVCQGQNKGTQLGCGEMQARDTLERPATSYPFQKVFYVYHDYDPSVRDRIMNIAPRVLFYPQGKTKPALAPWDGTSGNTDPTSLQTTLCANIPNFYGMEQGSVVLCMPDENNPIRVGASSVFHFHVTLKSGIPIQNIARSGERGDGLFASNVGPQGTTQAYLWMPGQKIGVIELPGAQAADKGSHVVHHPQELNDSRGVVITLVHTPGARSSISLKPDMSTEVLFRDVQGTPGSFHLAADYPTEIKTLTDGFRPVRLRP